MKQSKDLERLLKSLDGQKYGAYKRTKGIYQFDQFRLAIDHVQVEPFTVRLKCFNWVSTVRVKKSEVAIRLSLVSNNSLGISVSCFPIMTRIFEGGAKGSTWT